MLEFIEISNDPSFRNTLRYAQHGINANFIILGLIVLLYKIKYLNFARFYITRFYLILLDVYQLVGIIFLVEITFAYAYKIIYCMQEDHEKYGQGIIFKAFEFFDEDTFTTMWDLWKLKTSATGDDLVQFNFLIYFLTALMVVAVGTTLMLMYFLIAAIIESYNKVSQNLKNQKYLSRAKILFENSLIFRREEVFHDTRYVIKAQAEKIDGDTAKSDWDGVTAAISASVRTTVEQESEKTETNFKFLKNKIVKLQAAQETLQQIAE